MFCPKCAEAQTNEAVQFCTKCGLKLENVKSLIEAGGELKSQTSKQKGIRQGIKFIFLNVILFPIYIFLAPLFPANDVLVESSPSTTWFEQISWAIMTTLFMVGLVRIVYAFVFENVKTDSENHAENPQNTFKSGKKQNELPPQQGTPVSTFGRWKETTGDLFEPIFAERQNSGEIK